MGDDETKAAARRVARRILISADLNPADYNLGMVPGSPLVVCGGSGKLTPEARAELEAFAEHLRRKHHSIFCEGYCRFCASRAAVVSGRSNE